MTCMKEGGKDGCGTEGESGTEKKRTAAVLSPGKEVEWASPACYNKIREAGVSGTRLMGKEVCQSGMPFFLAQKPGKYSFSGLVHGRESIAW